MQITFDPLNAEDVQNVQHLATLLATAGKAAETVTQAAQSAVTPAQNPEPAAASQTAAPLPGMGQPTTAPAANPAPAAAPEQSVTLDQVKTEMANAITRKGGDPMAVFSALQAQVPGFQNLGAATPDQYPAIVACLQAL